MTYEEVMNKVQDVMDEMYKMELVDNRIAVDGETQIIGPQAELDSIVLVVFLTGMEERLDGKKLVLNSIHDFNVSDEKHKFDPFHPTLHVDTFVRYILTL